jgi:hypothetical protein
MSTSPDDLLTRWRGADFPPAFPGTTARTWVREYIPLLVKQGVLRKVGRAWFGKRSEIEGALMGRFTVEPTVNSKRTQGRSARTAA